MDLDVRTIARQAGHEALQSDERRTPVFAGADNHHEPRSSSAQTIDDQLTGLRAFCAFRTARIGRTVKYL